MKAKRKPKQQSTNVRQNQKTKEDFMRWWREQDARKKQAAAHSRALMVWADDGGAVD